MEKLRADTWDGKSVHRLVLVLLSVWVVYLLVSGILQWCGLSFGFLVWPMGEDRNWVGFINDGHGVHMTQLFWQMNDRNPLSAWWWFLASPFIRHWDWGIYAIRKLVDPFLAITTFLLLNRLGRGTSRTFAFVTALPVLMWNFNFFYEQIIWEFLVALGFTLLTIFFYCRYIDNKSRSGSDLALALLCYFVAFTTYTLQSGAIIGIALLAFFRSAQGQHLQARLKRTLVDSSFFGILFLLYDCIWYTVNRNGHLYYRLDPSSFYSRFIISFKQFIYHGTFNTFIHSTLSDWSLWTIAGIVFVAFLCLYSLLANLVAKRFLDLKTHIPWGWVLMVLLAISVPTMIIESTSSEWAPADRSIMVQQVWQPLLYVTFIFLFFRLFHYNASRKTQQAALLCTAFFGALVFTQSLNYNHHLVLRTHYQMALTDGLKNLHIPPDISPYFLLKTTSDNADINTISIFIPNYGSTMMRRSNVSLRAFATKPPAEGTRQPYWVIQFGTDKKGVINAASIGDTHPVPYKNLWIVYFDGEKVWVPATVNKKDLSGLQIDWQRKTPINQTMNHQWIMR
ncbi:MAG TPA: hypothetical protein VLJ15_07240 [Gammaproteobacteria bacterium]|nr:hypothetical protein [Gammaproteobacteria bacterium]